jgi:hypothetical protein
MTGIGKLVHYLEGRMGRTSWVRGLENVYEMTIRSDPSWLDYGMKGWRQRILQTVQMIAVLKEC